MTLALRTRFTQALAVGVSAVLLHPVNVGAVGAGSRIPWLGGSWYLHGANYPWKNYGNDFGSNAFGAYGVHAAGTYAAVDADFASMAAEGIHSTRWWMFSDGRAGITWDGNGNPTGVDQYVVPDLDAAVQIAAKHGVYLNLVLIDFGFMLAPTFVGGVQQGGHANVVNTAAGQQAFLNNVLVPIFQRYGNSASIISWEVMNEPEWCISDDGAVNSGCAQTASTLANFQNFTKSVATAVHTYTHSYVTVGSAAMKWASNWTGLGLDYYQIHYYDWMHPYSNTNLFGTAYSSLGLDAPVVVGEFPAANSSTATLQQYLDTWFGNGYAGAWPWSFKAVDGNGAPNAGVMSAFDAAHASVTNIGGSGGGAPGWMSLGGVMTSGPDASSSGANAVDVVVRGTDGGVWRLSWNGTTWGNWQPLGGGALNDPGTVAQGTRTDVFVHGTDNQLWVKTANSGVFGSWQPLGGVLTSGVDADAWTGTTVHEDVYARGSDGQLWHKWGDNGTWFFWEPLGGALTSDPGAVSWGPGRIDVFVRGTDNQLWHKWFVGGAWYGWEPLGGGLAAAPDAASCASGHLDVFVLGTDGQLWRKGYNGTSWSAWQPVGGHWTSGPSAVCRPTTTTIDLFARGTDLALWHNTVTGS